MEIGGHPEFRKENNKLQISHVTGVRTQNSLFNFKNQKEEYFFNSIRNAFKNETTIRPPAHTHMQTQNRRRFLLMIVKDA